MIWIRQWDGKIIRARCRHCHYLFRGEYDFENRFTGFGRCSTVTNAKGERVDIKVVNRNAYACPKFLPNDYITVYSNQEQLTLNF